MSTSSRALIRRPLAAFFNQFSDFTYNPRQPASAEIGRLLGSGLWDSVHEDEDALFEEYRDALTLEFNDRYGTDDNDLAAWQALCARIGLRPMPETVEACREAVKNTHVNLVDLVHVHDTNRTTKRFATVFELSEYTIRTKKYFPRDNAHAGNLLNSLLRHILRPELNLNGRQDHDHNRGRDHDHDHGRGRGRGRDRDGAGGRWRGRQARGRGGKIEGLSQGEADERRAPTRSVNWKDSKDFDQLYAGLQALRLGENGDDGILWRRG